MDTKAVAIVAGVLGFAVGALWMYRHLTCPVCQRRWAQWKRRIGLQLIE